MKGKLGRAASEREEMRNQTQKVVRQGGFQKLRCGQNLMLGRRGRKGLKTIGSRKKF